MTIQEYALPAPIGRTTVISESLLGMVIEKSRSSPRKRMILPFHKNPREPLHRMLNGIQPFSYIRPHRHLIPPKPESIIVLRGAILCLVFSSTGDITEVQRLAADSGDFGFDSEAGVYHTFLALQPDSVIFEVKPGPYDPEMDKDFAPWAPLAESSGVDRYLAFLYSFEKKP